MKAKKNKKNKTNKVVERNSFEEPIVEEKKISKKKLWNVILIIAAIAGIGIASLVLLFALYIIISSPSFDRDLLYKKEATILYDSKGEEFARIGTENRELVTYEDLPQVLIDALLATEDSRFFQHNGLDGARFLVASIKQVVGNSSAGGASTLSMQVIKNTYTGKEASGVKGIIRKFTDIYMAVFKLESTSTKEEIIEFYLNSQWLGNDGNLNYSGIYGIEQASQYYFGKHVNDLNLSEAAMLVGMFQNPTAYNPYTHPQKCQNRRSTVLKLMVKHGYISEEERKIADSIDVRSMLKPKQESVKSAYQSFIDYVIDDVEKTTGDDPTKVSMKIYTTLDMDIQNAVNKIVNGETFKWPNKDLQIGLAVTSVENGSVLAMSGGRDYAAKGLNRATDVKRQPGSTAKILFDYGPYIEYLNGSTYGFVIDEPHSYTGGKKIHNYDNGYKGMMTVREALVDSRNVPALKTFQKVYKENPSYIADFVHSLGIDYGEGLYESMAIGAFNGTNPLQMSAAYASYGRGGYYIKPYSFTKIVYDDDSTYENKYNKNQVMSAETAYMITDMLVTGGKRNVAGHLNVSGSQIAAKGGTTNLDAASKAALGVPSGATPDHWNITYSPDYCTALWLGYDTTTKEHYLTSATGGKMRRTIMSSLVNKLYKKNRTFSKPSGVVSKTVEWETMPPQLPSEYTPDNMKRTELFRKGTEPTEQSTRYSKLAAPKNGSATFDGKNIKLTWSAIDTPDAINPTYLQEYFNKGYGSDASKYYQKRLTYNKKNIGTLVYHVYLKDPVTKSLKSLGTTANNSYSYPANASTSAYTFVVTSEYSIFRKNASEGLTINAYARMDSNVSDIVTDNTNTQQDSTSDELD